MFTLVPVIFVLEMLRDVKFGAFVVSFALCSCPEHISASHNFSIRTWFSNLESAIEL